MLMLNDAQAMIVRLLLTKMLINDTYSVNQLEEALTWFEREDSKVSCPFEQVWSKQLAQDIVQALRNQS
jgi:hypothetical protein